jgi:predicted secreted protein
MNIQSAIKASFNALLSSKIKNHIEKTILVIAILSYLVHLLLIFLNVEGFITLEQKFFKNPIAAIYTPFSFILIYEVYLLIYFLPKSITVYIGKQYEIITLIVIRRIFKDIAYVELTSDWFQDKDDLQFTFDVLTSLILFFLIYLFYKSMRKKAYQVIETPEDENLKIKKFILLKQFLATILVPLLVILAFYTVIHWSSTAISDNANGIMEFKKINNIFFDEFFSVLIIVDVLLLLFSFFYSDEFHKIIRNSGFVISTILIKVSFLSDGIVNNILIVGAVLFGYMILVIHNLYEKDILSGEIKDGE